MLPVSKNLEIVFLPPAVPSSPQHSVPLSVNTGSSMVFMKTAPSSNTCFEFGPKKLAPSMLSEHRYLFLFASLTFLPFGMHTTLPIPHLCLPLTYNFLFLNFHNFSHFGFHMDELSNLVAALGLFLIWIVSHVSNQRHTWAGLF